MGVKRNNAVGVKGKSGRKSAPVEFAKAQAIIRAWNKVLENIESSDVKEIALPLALKDMASKVSNADGSNIELQQVLVKFISNESERT